MNKENIKNMLLKGLNKSQKKVVNSSLNQTYRILASAGSGKTKVITRRYGFLSSVLQIDYEKILVITINENSVNEMKNRISRFFSFSDDKKINIHTFYTLCGKILREDIDKLNFTKNYTLMDESDKKEIIKQIFRHKNLKEGTIKPKDVFNYITINKIQNKDPKELLKNATSEISKLKAQFFVSYEKYLKRNKSLDYDGLILNTYKLFTEFPDIAKKWNNYFSAILIDEFQDIGYLEYEILKYISSDTSMTIVGDVNKTIYSPKGTDVKYILEFDKVFSNTKTIFLNENYRSSLAIVEAANNLIKHNNENFENPIKEMITANTNTEKIEYHHSFSPDAEARWVVHKINDLKRNKVQLKDIAIFYRSSFYSKSFEDELTKAKINYEIIDDDKFYERKEVKDCISFLKLIYNGSATALLRVLNVPNRNISHIFEKKLLEYSNKRKEELFVAICNLFKDTKNEVIKKMKLQWNAKNKEVLKNLVFLINAIRKFQKVLSKHSISKILLHFLREIHYFEYIKEDEYNEGNKEKNVRELLVSIENWEVKNPQKNLGDYLEEISLISSRNINSLGKNYISLISSLNTKGTHFKNVFIVGLCKYVWPSLKSMNYLNNIELHKNLDNERRLFYIAITRTVDKLFLSDSQGFYNSNLKYKKTPSIFLTEIGLDLSNYSSNVNSKKNNKKDELEVGIIVMHDIFGEGTVMDVNSDTVTVAFRHPHEAKILKKNHPTLKRK